MCTLSLLQQQIDFFPLNYIQKHHHNGDRNRSSTTITTHKAPSTTISPTSNLNGYSDITLPSPTAADRIRAKLLLQSIKLIIAITLTLAFASAIYHHDQKERKDPNYAIPLLMAHRKGPPWWLPQQEAVPHSISAAKCLRVMMSRACPTEKFSHCYSHPILRRPRCP